MTQVSMRLVLAAGGAALALLGVAPAAHAAATVLGAGQARVCYSGVVLQASKERVMKACNAALSDEVLHRQDRAATHVNRGILYLRERQLDRAQQDFDTALRLLPDLGEAHVNKGAVLLLKGKPKEAVDSIDLGLKNGLSEPWNAYFNRAHAYERLGDFEAAYEDFKQAATLKPDWPAPAEELTRFTVVPAGSPTDAGR